MIRVRKLVLAIAAATSLTSGMAHALGLGDISLQSALNQPLNANIELLEVRDLDKSEIIPRLASAEDFSKAGVDRGYFLTNLKFTTVMLPNGKSSVRVSSSKPVVEPYLNFLVEVVWPSGRVLREYTLLLDPPLYSPETAMAAAPRLPIAAPVPVTAPRSSNKPIDGPFKVSSAPGSAPVVRSDSSPKQASAAALDGQYKTRSSDTLWEIAQRTRGGSSLNQTMLAIQDLNPDAFVGGNINRLKSGQVLRLPDASQINARSASDAALAVAEQNSAWREGRSLPTAGALQLDATKRDEAGNAPATVEAADSLRLVAADAGKAEAGSDKGAGDDTKAIVDKLAVSQENLDTAVRQGDELKGRVSDLQGQLEKLQKLIELKDSQLAKLQADLAAQAILAAQTPVPAAVPVPAEASAEATAEPAPVAIVAVEPQAVSAPAEVAVPDTQPVVEAVVPVATEPESVSVVETPVAPEPEAAAKPVEAIEPVQIVTETVEVSEPEPEPIGLLDQLMANPLLLGAGGVGLLVLLLALMARARRNTLTESESSSQDSYKTVEDDSFADDIDLPEDSFAGLDEVARDQADEPVKAQTGDPLSEADIYIAYGKFNQAAELLQGALNEEPHRADLQLKLMEVMGELGDRDGFLRQQEELQAMGGFKAELEQIKARYPAMAAAGFAAGVGVVAAASQGDAFSVDDLITDAPVPAGQDADDAFDINLDDLELGADDELHVAALASEKNLDEFSLDIDFDAPASKPSDDNDFGLSLAPLSDELPAFEPNTAEKQDDHFSDFSFDLETDPALAPAAVTSDEFSAGLDGDFEFDSDSLDVDLQKDAGQAPSEGFDLTAAVESQPLEPIADQFDDLGASFTEFTGQDGSPLLQTQDDLTADDDDFDFLSGTDEAATKLDLARAYIDMGDAEGARDILDEVVSEGNEAQQQEARDLKGKLV